MHVLITMNLAGGGTLNDVIRFYPHRELHRYKKSWVHWTEEYRIDLSEKTAAMAAFQRIYKKHDLEVLHKFQTEMYEPYADLGVELRELVHDTDKFVQQEAALKCLSWHQPMSEPVCKPQLMWRMLDSAVLCVSDIPDPRVSEILDPNPKSGELIEGTYVADVQTYLARYVAWVRRAARLVLKNKKFLLYMQADAVRRDRQRAVGQLMRLQRRLGAR